MKKIFTLNNILLVFYLALMLMMLAGPTDSAPGTAIRYVFLIAFFAPLLTERKTYLPAILLCFLIVMYNSPVFCPLPYSFDIYILILIIGLFFWGCYRRNRLPIPYVCFFLLLCVMDFITEFKIFPVEYVFIICILLFFYLDFSDEKSIDLFLNSFCISSVVLSIYYFLNFENYLTMYGNESDGLIRSGWIDPNYFSSVIGLGELNAVYLLFKGKNYNIFHKLFLLTTIGISILAEIVIASRGAILATVVAIAFLLLRTKISTKYKVIFILFASALLYFLFTHNVFELLLYRLNNDSGTGSGRTIIWQKKLEGYLNFNPIEMLFGIGFDPGMRLGFGEGRGFHNDFIGFLCCYGLLGLVLFCYALFYPLKRAIHSFRPTIMCFILYLVVICLTLEPFLNGLIAFWAYYLLIVAMSEQSRTIE